MKEMVGGLKRPEDYQVFLVLSATTKYRDLQKIADCYGKIAKFELILQSWMKQKQWGIC